MNKHPQIVDIYNYLHGLQYQDKPDYKLVRKMLKEIEYNSAAMTMRKDQV